MGFWTNTQDGKEKDSGSTNGVKVKCAKCKTEQYITPGMSWKCFSCQHEHSQ